MEISNYTADKIYSFNGDYVQFKKYIDSISHNEFTLIATEKAIDNDSSVSNMSTLPSTQDNDVKALYSGYNGKVIQLPTVLIHIYLENIHMIQNLQIIGTL